MSKLNNWLIVATIFIVLAISKCAYADPTFRNGKINWNTVDDGFEVGRYRFTLPSSVIESEIILLRISPLKFKFEVSLAIDQGVTRADLSSLMKSKQSVAGINANFFDPSGAPLGLIIDNGKVKNRIQSGGALLTGIFYIRDRVANIAHRNAFSNDRISLALQTGPRLIANGAALKVKSTMFSSRRSGVALNKKGDVILFATVLRFPGASFEDLQRMLQLPELEVVSALNFDGGGSSQLRVEKFGKLKEEINISGGDLVPVALVVNKSE
jgi:uncharacterized protein YigE (DUF2233 family)